LKITAHNNSVQLLHSDGT